MKKHKKEKLPASGVVALPSTSWLPEQAWKFNGNIVWDKHIKQVDKISNLCNNNWRIQCTVTMPNLILGG